MKLVEGFCESGYSIWLYRGDECYFDILPADASPPRILWAKIKLFARAYL